MLALAVIQVVLQTCSVTCVAAFFIKTIWKCQFMANSKIVGRVPLNEKLNLTVAEAAVYSGIGQNTIREWLKKEDCPFLLWVNDKKLVIRRKEFEVFCILLMI